MPRRLHRFPIVFTLLLAAAGCGRDATSPQPVAALSITPPAEPLHAGESVRLQPVAADSRGASIAHPRLSWSSSDTAVAKVDGSGKVSGIRAGYAAITASAAGGASAALDLYVIHTRVKKLDIGPDTLTARLGTLVDVPFTATDASKAAVEVPNGPDVSVSDTSVLRVEQGGLRAAGAGTALVLLSVDGAADSAVVVVTAPAAIAVWPDTVLLLVADSARKLQAEVPGPPAATYPLEHGIAWSSSNPSVAAVDAEGRVTALAPGEAVVTATVAHTSVAASTRVYVKRYQPALDFVEIVGGMNYRCGRTADGRAFCWQDPIVAGFDGPLGSLAPTDRCRQQVYYGRAGSPASWDYQRCSRVPVEVDGGHRFGSLAGGPYGACGVDTAGQVWCWGREPVRVAGLPSAVQVAAGYDFTCALAADGQAWCWGGNRSGQLGDGTTTTSAAPVAVAGGHRFRAIFAGQIGSACGLEADGTAWCWGGNGGGTLGDSTTTDRLQPVAVKTGVRFATLAMGLDETCGLDAAGMAYCWGSGAVPARTEAPLVPVPAPAAGPFTAIQVRSSLACGLRPAGTLACWGAGAGAARVAEGPAPGSAWTAVGVGFDRTCGATADRRVYCWTTLEATGWSLRYTPTGG